MGVYEAPDRFGGGYGRPHLRQHLAGQLEVEQRIDQQRLAMIDDEAGIAEPPTAVGLEVGKAAVAQIMQAFGVLPLRYAVLPHRSAGIRTPR